MLSRRALSHLSVTFVLYSIFDHCRDEERQRKKKQPLEILIDEYSISFFAQSG